MMGTTATATGPDATAADATVPLAAAVKHRLCMAVYSAHAHVNYMVRAHILRACCVVVYSVLSCFLQQRINQWLL
jgi:hypothetical protein